MRDKDSFKFVIAEAADGFRVCFVAKYASKDEAEEDIRRRLGTSEEIKIILFLEEYPPRCLYGKDSTHSRQQADSPEIIEGHKAIMALLELDGFRQAFGFILGEICNLLPH